MTAMIYLDNAATTPVDPLVAAAMAACLTPDGDFANAASTHALGLRARGRVEEARRLVAARIGVAPNRLLFTSGATEANNLAIKGVVRASRKARPHVVTSRIEHKSVGESARAAAALGADVTYLACDSRGLVSPDQVEAALTDRTVLVSIMHVNNELGSVADIEALAAICRQRGALLHTDAAQSAGKIPVDLDAWGVDLCSLTAHKINGPKGIGALYVRAGVELEPLLHGGEPELGVRGGTLATHQIAGMGQAFALADPRVEGARLAELRDQLWRGLEAIGGVSRNGAPDRSAPHILSVTFRGVDGTSLLCAVPDVAVSQGSACSSSVPEPSAVLTAIGLSDALAQSTVRFGIGRFTQRSDIDYAIERFGAQFRRLRALAPGAPAWCSG
jgi:cysteine desulfurase